ncbi:hypothetical protein [Sinorhizobium glycinis]|uniref:hypothetical protein n=1 Tax=Sinorhizobium glycinis TaxID=1472378 RepID=UPI000AF96EAA|nr:hypothetical protein [Sinorhizobium glycinis]
MIWIIGAFCPEFFAKARGRQSSRRLPDRREAGVFKGSLLSNLGRRVPVINTSKPHHEVPHLSPKSAGIALPIIRLGSNVIGKAAAFEKD